MTWRLDDQHVICSWTLRWSKLRWKEVLKRVVRPSKYGTTVFITATATTAKECTTSVVKTVTIIQHARSDKWNTVERRTGVKLRWLFGYSFVLRSQMFGVLSQRSHHFCSSFRSSCIHNWLLRQASSWYLALVEGNITVEIKL